MSCIHSPLTHLIFFVCFSHDMGAASPRSLSNPGDVTFSADCHKKSRFRHILDEIVRLLRRLWDALVCCVTCGACPYSHEDLAAEVYETELMEEERNAVHNLLKYLDSADSKEPTVNDERLRALCILTYSDNDALQRSAALCFAEISERMTTAVPEVVLEPLVVLLRSRDPHVQKAASLAMSNFSLNGPEINKTTIMNAGATKPLVQLLYSRNTEVQCNTCGCITTLATNDRNKQAIVFAGGIQPLLVLCKSSDIRVQRNATGALLNLTHLQSNRSELVKRGALPVLVSVICDSRDADVQYYCAAALSNMAVDETHRPIMTGVGHYDVIRRLIQLLNARQEKVKCQACLALRNLASDADNQINIVKLGGLTSLHTLVSCSRGDTLTAALACLRNLSINKSNESAIIQATFLTDLQQYVCEFVNSEAQAHAAGTIRNLAAGDDIESMSESGCLFSLMDVLLDGRTEGPVLVEVTAALAVLADEDSNKESILGYSHGAVFNRLIDLAANSDDTEVQYNCAGTIGQIAMKDISSSLEYSIDNLLNYLNNFLWNADQNFVHISLWTIVQLLKFELFKEEFVRHPAYHRVSELSQAGKTAAIRELTATVINTFQDS